MAGVESQRAACLRIGCMQVRLVEAQLGTDPGQAHPTARLQWSTLCRARTRSLHVDAATGAVDVLGMLIAKVRTGRFRYADSVEQMIAAAAQSHTASPQLCRQAL